MQTLQGKDHIPGIRGVQEGNGETEGRRQIATPADIGAERAFLGSIFIDSTLLDDVSLSPSDFYRNDNRLVFESMQRLHSQGIGVDCIAIATDMKNHSTLHDAGGVANLTALSTFTPTAHNAKHYADTIVDCSKRRQIMRIAQEAIYNARTAENVADVLQKVETQLSEVSNDGLKRVYNAVGMAKDVFHWVRDRREKEDSGVKTGIPMLDRITHGFQQTDLIFLAARPSMGKTALAVNWALYAASSRRSVAFFSLEMSMYQIMSRITAIFSGIEADKIMNPKGLTDEELEAVDYSLRFIAKNFRLFVDDTAAVTVAEIAAKARTIKRQSGLDVIFIDYLQLIKGNRAENRTQEVGQITRDLKQLAKELNVPVICLSQLSRSVESRSDKTPMLSDLRDSGEIEQNCDLCLMIYRDEYYNPNTDKKYTELTIAKNRNGELGKIKLFFNKRTQMLTEDDKHSPEDYGTEVKKREQVAF